MRAKPRDVTLSRDSGIVAAHPVLDAFDHRAALAAVARAALRRSSASMVRSRHWFVVWPSIPEPVLYLVACRAPLTPAACAA
jgi:hypothetical protein